MFEEWESIEYSDEHACCALHLYSMEIGIEFKVTINENFKKRKKWKFLFEDFKENTEEIYGMNLAVKIF